MIKNIAIVITVSIILLSCVSESPLPVHRYRILDGSNIIELDATICTSRLYSRFNKSLLDTRCYIDGDQWSGHEIFHGLVNTVVIVKNDEQTSK